ncbi:hypothetical protein TrVGV298_000036 [Trichoderma virens]|nr:hypothetical protein TrVGV298_000036 [Trichoderma virens]
MPGNRLNRGVWQRSVDEIEQAYAVLSKLYEGSGRMFFAITGHISLSFNSLDSLDDGSDTRVDTALRKAWLTLRHDHPTIASQVKYNAGMNSFTKLYRTIPTIADQQVWLDQTFVKVSTNQTGSEWANNDPPAPELPTLFVITPPSLPREGNRPGLICRDLVLRSPHDVIDGVGTLLLLGNLVNIGSKAYNQGSLFQLPTFDDGSEFGNMSPPFRVAANLPKSLTERQQQRLANVAALKEQQLESNIPLLLIPWKKGEVVPGMHQRIALTISQEKTSKLLHACSYIGVTVTHLFHAAIPIMMRDLQTKGPKQQRARYVSYILRNERGNCTEPYNSAKHPAALYHSGSGTSLLVDINIPATGDNNTLEQHRAESKEFFRVLQEMKKFYHDIRDDAEHFQLAPYYWAAGTRELPPAVKGPLAVPPPSAQPSVSISSLGIVDKIIPPEAGAISVFDPWVTGEELRNGLGFFLGTYRNQLCLSAAYNAAWHSKQEVEKYLETCVDVVFRGA